MWSPTSSGRRIAAPMRRRFARQSRDPTCGSCRQVEQQSCLMLHRARHLLIRQQTAVINSLRAYLAEFGIVAPVGRRGVEQLLEVVADPADRRLPEVARACLVTAGALAVSRYAKIHGTGHRPWLTALLARRPTKIAATALANKIARKALGPTAGGQRYRETD